MRTRAAITIFAVTTFGLIACQQGLDLDEASSAQASHLAGGAIVNDGSDPRGFQSGNQRFGNLQTVRKALVKIPAAIDIEPVNGQLFPNRTVSGMLVHFQGFTTAASTRVDVQVLNDANAPISESNWVTIGSAVSSASGTSFNDPTPVFAWSLDATPSQNNDGRWEQGGILRYRTVAIDGQGKRTALPYYDLDAGDCIKQQGNKSWKDVVKACKSVFSPNIGDAISSATKAATLLSPSPQPRDLFKPSYLSRRGAITANDTDRYYDTINAPRTLNDFAARFGFRASKNDGFFDDSDDGQAVASGNYYNLGDLGLGREIHCKQFTAPGGEPGTACITKNYGVDASGKADFSGDAQSAMADNLAHAKSFAAVCMVKIGNTFGPAAGNDVQFMVYGADGNIVNQAQLDSIGSNEAIPNNCLNCHGGIYDQGKRAVIGASFLPYDPESFLFANESGSRYLDQEDSFRQLNVMVKASGAPPGTVSFINGLYGNKAEKAGTHANFDWVPPGWSTSPEAKTVYNQAYKHYCRTCHTSQVGDFAFINYIDFKGVADKTTNDICHLSEMPVCEGTMQQFWQSSARAYIVNSAGVSDSCTANDSQNDGDQ